MKVLTAILSSIFAFFTVIFTSVFLVGLFSFVTGCGTYEVPKTEVVEAAGECGEERVCTAEEDNEGNSGKDSDNENKAAKDSVIDSDINASDISVSSDENGESVEKTKLIFVSKSKTWTEHMESTPEGYRMATRSDVIKTLETGEFDELMDRDEVIYTSTESSQLSEMVWVVGFVNDFEVMKTLEFPTLYVAE